MTTAIRRTAMVSVATVTMLALMATSALAHFCYNASRSEQGNKGAGSSVAWVSAEDILRDEVGLCDAGVDHVLDGAAELGYPQPLMIHSKVVLASGVAGTAKSFDDTGIDHLDFEELDPLVGEAFGICAGA